MKKADDSYVMLLLQSLVGQADVMVIHRLFIDFMGSIEGALLLGQIIYWTPRSSLPDGWFYKTYADWENETTLSKYQVSKIIEKLEKDKIITTEVRKAEGAPTVHYHLNKKEFEESLQSFVESEDPHNGKSRNLTIESEETSLSKVKKVDEPVTKTTHRLQTKEKKVPALSSPKKKKKEEKPHPLEQWARTLATQSIHSRFEFNTDSATDAQIVKCLLDSYDKAEQEVGDRAQEAVRNAVLLWGDDIVARQEGQGWKITPKIFLKDWINPWGGGKDEKNAMAEYWKHVLGNPDDEPDTDREFAPIPELQFEFQSMDPPKKELGIDYDFIKERVGVNAKRTREQIKNIQPKEETHEDIAKATDVKEKFSKQLAMIQQAGGDA